jgi:S-adenosylmethionine synthetase
MSITDYLFTSESVTEGHPDKVADQISDAILDAIIAQDKNARVACEALVTTGLAFIAGEITTGCWVDMPSIVRETIKEIGYNDSAMGFDWETCGVLTSIDKQSPDIAMGVNGAAEQGAGDQGLMFGYACKDTPELMPMPILYAHRLTRRLAEVRKTGILDFLRPDGKSQVTIRYSNCCPVEVTAVVIAAQHKDSVSTERVREGVAEEVIRKVIPEGLLTPKTKLYINTTGRFVVGGPLGDCGMTGRKIIVDTYGGVGSHGGGAFSGKDPSKVDRTASYMARYIAKNLVAADLATKCEVQLAYAIGKADPVSVMVDDYDTAVIPNAKLTQLVKDIFPLRPRPMIDHLDLLNPIFKRTAVSGHFGREEDGFNWEKRDMVEKLKIAAGRM